MLTLNDGRAELWQWDTGRTLSVDADCSQVHFSNKVFGRSIDVDVADGVAVIPDILLQTDKDLNVWAFVGTAENGYTKISKTFTVNRRNKPADYVFTPQDQTSLEEIKEKIDYLESIQDPDAIKNAVEDYLEKNPVEAPVQSVNGRTGEVELTAEDVGAVSQGDLQEATNEALAQAKASGEFDGADGITPTIGDNGNWYLGDTDTGKLSRGEPGHTPVKGTDYFTAADKQEITEAAAGMVSIPDKLPNPNALTFTGAVTGSYDGSSKMSARIPQVVSWANKELFDKADLVDPGNLNSFVTVDGVEYYRYHAGGTYGFTWNNPHPLPGSVTITARGVSQYGGSGDTRLKTIYDDDTYGPDLYIVASGESKTATVTTDASKTLAKITGNYDLENWVLLDMSVMSIVANYNVGVPLADSNVPGGIKADPATETDTVPAKIGSDGKLYVPDMSGGGGGIASGDYIPVPPTAEVGQTIVVKAVDEDGKPTEWEAADMPNGGGGWDLITDITLTEDGGGGSMLSVTRNDKGEEFEYRQCMVCLSGTIIDGWPSGASQSIYLHENNSATGRSASQTLSRLPAGAGGTGYKTTVEMSIFGNLVRVIACGGSADTSSLIIRGETPIDTFRSIKLSCYGNNQWASVPLAAGGRVVIYGRK